MRGRFLLGSNRVLVGGNIYANKSSIVLDWLLHAGTCKKKFSIREVARDTGVSIGLVQRVFGFLVLNGLLKTMGVRTAKEFFIQNPELLLKSWIEYYSIVKKCKMWAYRTGFQGKGELLKALAKSNLNQKVALALHSAAEAHGCKGTNLQTLELYLLDSSIGAQLEKALQLEPQERGYEVLLIKPYYKNLLNQHIGLSKEKTNVSPVLLTFLDLYHFPLRGQEQAEFMSERIDELKTIYKRG